MNNSNEMQQNLYKILRMNIILAKSSGEIVSEDTLQSFDDAAKKIDEIDNIKYDEDIKDLYYATTTLEEEKKRLEKLVSIIDKRIEERKNLIVDYKETTNRPLEALGYIKDEDKIDEYKERLANINTYLSNKDNIIKIEEELRELHTKVEECYNSKQKDEANNFELEDDLLLNFKNIISSSTYSDILSAVDIDFELEKLKPDVINAKKTLNTFETAFNNLKKASISLDSEAEYSSYVEDAKKSYYFVKEKEFLYDIYKIIIDSKNIYSELYNKRDNLDKVLGERLNLRLEIGIFEEDMLNDLYALIDKQNKSILRQKENIDNIASIEDKIKFKELKLNELKEDNKKVEILSLLQEFGIIDTYKSDVTLDLPKVVEEEPKEEIKEEKIEEKEEILLPNMVVDVKDAYENLNLSFARSKADTVMRRVGRSLGYAPEVKKESLVTFDFDKPKEEKQEEVKVEEIKPVESVENTQVVTEENNTNNDNNLNNITFPNIEESGNAVADDNTIDKDFWSVDSDKIFPALEKDEDYKVEQEQPGMRLDFPLDFGGSDENRG